MMTKENIAEEFVQLALRHGSAIQQGDYKTANKIHRQLQRLYTIAHEMGRPEMFAEFLREEDENVRLWAAVYTLKYNAHTAEEVLNDLSKLKSITALTADTTLKMWKQGLLNLL